MASELSLKKNLHVEYGICVYSPSTLTLNFEEETDDLNDYG